MATATLPYPNMDFVPLDILTAAEMNQMVANDQYLAQFANGLADGSNLSNGIIQARHLRDTGWRNLPITGGTAAINENAPRYRRIGDQVFCIGLVTGQTGSNSMSATLPVGFRPDINIGTGSISSSRLPFFAMTSGSASANISLYGDGRIAPTQTLSGSYIMWAIEFLTADPFPTN